MKVKKSNLILIWFLFIQLNIILLCIIPSVKGQRYHAVPIQTNVVFAEKYCKKFYGSPSGLNKVKQRPKTSEEKRE